MRKKCVPVKVVKLSLTHGGSVRESIIVQKNLFRETEKLADDFTWCAADVSLALIVSPRSMNLTNKSPFLPTKDRSQDSSCRQVMLELFFRQMGMTPLHEMSFALMCKVKHPCSVTLNVVVQIFIIIQNSAYLDGNITNVSRQHPYRFTRHRQSTFLAPILHRVSCV